MFSEYRAEGLVTENNTNLHTVIYMCTKRAPLHQLITTCLSVHLQSVIGYNCYFNQNYFQINFPEVVGVGPIPSPESFSSPYFIHISDLIPLFTVSAIF